MPLAPAEPNVNGNPAVARRALQRSAMFRTVVLKSAFRFAPWSEGTFWRSPFYEHYAPTGGETWSVRSHPRGLVFSAAESSARLCDGRRTLHTELP
jgi:hypothetical protein